MRLRRERDELEPTKRQAALFLGAGKPAGNIGTPRLFRPKPFAVVYSALLLAGAASTVLVYILLVREVPGAAANRTDAVKTALLVIGGSGFLAGLYVAYRKQRTDEANHLRDQDELFTERYVQAASQLGSDKAAVRLAGVYALGRIADDSVRHRATCLSLLCAVLRMPYDPEMGDPAERQVRVTAQLALRDRLIPTRQFQFCRQAEINLDGAVLIDLNLTFASVVSFSAAAAVFTGAMTVLDQARFGSANFAGAGFEAEETSIAASFVDCADFFDARFSLGASFNRALFNSVDFEGAVFDDQTTFEHCEFIGDACFSGVTFHNTVVFTGARFKADAQFNGARFNTAAEFYRVVFNGYAAFAAAHFADGVFDESVFESDIDFTDAYVAMCSFKDVTGDTDAFQG